VSSDRSREIVRILESGASWTTASQIASQVGCSSRTVKSDITALNRTHEGMIVASSKGYRIEDATAAAQLLSQQANEVPQTAEARKRYILFELLMRHRKVRAADLAESLYISLATLDNELVAIKRELSGYGLVLRSRAGSLYIEGSASGEKKMVNQLIFDETKDYFSQIDLINRYFPKLDLAQLQERIDACLKRRGFYINGYALSSLIIHIAIFVERTSNGFESVPTTVKAAQPAGNEAREGLDEVAGEVCAAIEGLFSVLVSDADRDAVRLMLGANLIHANRFEPSDPEHRHARELLGAIVERVHDQFGLNLSDGEFELRFSLHLANMLSRVRCGMLLRNPQLEAIKSSQPFIYDVAVFVADVIAAETGVSVNEDEIAYIALHVGCLVEGQRANADKLHALVVCTRHNAYETHIDSFLDALDACVVVEGIVPAIDAAGDISRVDLVISTVPLSGYCPVPVVNVSPFFSKQDISLMRERVEALLKARLRTNLECSMRTFFTEDFFAIEPEVDDWRDAICKMSAPLIEGGYAFENFTERLLEREDISSSAYCDIAMPHPLDMDAKRTAVSVALFPRGLAWNNATVHAVIMLSITRDDRAFFGELFNYISGVLLKPGAVRAISHAKSYQEFLDALLRCA